MDSETHPCQVIGAGGGKVNKLFKMKHREKVIGWLKENNIEIGENE